MSTRADAVLAQQDGLHNIVTDPAFRDVLVGAVAQAFAPLIEPELIEEVRRFVAKGRRNDSRSYAVGSEPPAAGVAGRVKILERDEARVRAFIFNNGANPIFWGGRQVTVGGPNDASGGIPLAAGTGMWIEQNVGEIWAVSANVGMDVRVLDVSGGI